jgi:uncharacterized protein with PQ loop repeat
MVEFIGWIATTLLVVRTFPQVHKCYRKGNAKGLSRSFLWLWFVGQVLMLIYLSLQMIAVPLIVYSVINLFSLLVILKYRYYPRLEKFEPPSIEEIRSDIFLLTEEELDELGM